MNSITLKYAAYRRHVIFCTGIGLIAGSFLVYLAYPLVVFLPLSAGLRIAVIIVASVLSWSVFCVGVFLAGLEGYEWLKQLLKKRILRW